MPAMPELDEEEFLELPLLLRQTVTTDPSALTPRIRKLQAILDKLEPAAARPRPHLAPRSPGEPSAMCGE